MWLSFSKNGIRDSNQISTTAPIFLQFNYFRQNLEENVTFTFYFFSFASNFPCKILWNNKDIDANICIFQIAFSQWRAGLWKKLFWDVFLQLASFIFMKNFSFHSSALHVFCQKITYFLSYLWGKYFSCKMFTVLHQSRKNLSDLGKNWAKTKQLLLKRFQLLIAMEGCIVHWYLKVFTQCSLDEEWYV